MHVPDARAGRPVRTRSVAALMALLLAATTAFVGGLVPAAPAGAQEEPEPAELVEITEGLVTWGVRESFRNYIGAAGVTVEDGLTQNALGEFLWDVVGGTYDPDSHRLELDVAGTVSFYMHEGALDMTFRHLRVVIEGDVSQVTAEVESRRLDGEMVDYGRVPLVDMVLDDVDPAIEDDSTTWTRIPTFLTEVGGDVFGGFYPVGGSMDAVSITYEGPGGKPERTQERWTEPASPTYERVADLNGLQYILNLVPDTERGLLHVHRYDPTSETYRLEARDIDTLEAIGESVSVSSSMTGWPGMVLAADSGTVVGAAGGDLHFFTWKPETQAYESTTVSAGGSIQGMHYDGDDGRSRLIVGTNASLAIVEPDAEELSGWRRTSYNTVGFSNRPTFAAVSDTVILTTSSIVSINPGVRQIDLHEDGPATVAPVPGDFGSPDLQATFNQPSYIHRFGDEFVLVNTAGDRFRIGLVDDVWQQVGERVPGTMNAILVSRDHAPSGRLVLASYSMRAIQVLGDDGHHMISLPSLGAATAIWHVAVGAGSDGTVYAAETSSSGPEDSGIRVFRPLGVSPAFTDAPEDVTVTVPPGSSSTEVVLEAETTGDPAPEIQWQSRIGAAPFVDVEGATGPTLATEVGPDDEGRQYRAVATNPAGALATDPATVTVHHAPGVIAQLEDVSVVEGDDAELKVMPSGNPYPEVTWQRYSGGFWWNIGADDDGFVVDGGFLTVTDTNTDQDGTLFRARLRNEVATSYTRTATLSVAERNVDPRYVVGGDLEWGVRASFRNYIQGPIAQGDIEVVDPATPTEAGTFGFPAAMGTVEDQVVEAGFDGAVRFTGHVGHGTPEGVPALDMHISNIRIEVDGQDGILIADVVSRGLSDGELTTYDDVPFAALDLSGVSPTPVEGGLRWADVPAVLTEEGVPAFADFYPAGDPLDPVSFTLLLSDEAPEPGDPRTATESFVTAALVDFLGIDPTEAQVAAGVAQVQASGKTAFLRSLTTSDEWLTAIVDRRYQDTLGRPSDGSGAEFWRGRIRAGWSVARVAASFYASPEYYTGIGGGTDETWVADLYQKILLRSPDAGGVQYWVAETAARGRGNVALRFYQTTESAQTRVKGLYEELLGRNPEPAGLTHWAPRVVREGDLALAVNLASSGEYQNRAENRYP